MFLSTPPVWVATTFYSTFSTLLSFLSTPPVWVATRQGRYWHNATAVSIHATRVGGDKNVGLSANEYLGFYPRHPCGWRQQKCTKMDTLLRKSVNFSFQFIKNKTTKKIYKKLIEHYIFGCLNCLVRSP